MPREMGHDQQAIRDLSLLLGSDWRIDGDGRELYDDSGRVRATCIRGHVRIVFPDPFSADSTADMYFTQWTYGTVSAVLGQVELMVRLAFSNREEVNP